MRNFIKKSMSVLLAAVLMCMFWLPMRAEDVDVSDEVEALRYYFYHRGADLDTLLGYGNYGNMVLRSIRFYGDFWESIGVKKNDYSQLYIQPDESTAQKAQALLAQLALDLPVELVDAFTQQQDGSFAGCETVADNLICFIALEAAQKKVTDRAVYSSRLAKEWTLSMQGEDGSFGGDAVTTALALSYLSMFAEEEAISRGAMYIRGQIDTLQTVTQIADVICGLSDAGVAVNSGDYQNLPGILASYKQSDGSYGQVEESLHALAAFDSLASQQSPYKKLMTNGSYSDNLLQKLTPLLLIYGVLALLSVVFWLYIFLGKPKIRRMEETE